MPSIPQTQSHDSRPSPSLCLYCKSFRRDLDRVQQLVASLEAHNRDHLPLILSVPAADVALFQARFGKHHFELIPDETLTGRSIPAGWRMQQVVKFHVWQMNLADTVFMLDSDAYFIRDFRRQDFFTQTGEPYFILSSFPTRFAPENTELLTLLQGQNTPPPLDLSQLLLPPVAPQDMGTIPRWRLW
ncbi:MAG: DUF6492 family protein, partial [Jaaginema sp. PMC 1079.18]|nr:DUF6492 family protein [Jaaginema sp. PMC 1079.18]